MQRQHGDIFVQRLEIITNSRRGQKRQPPPQTSPLKSSLIPISLTSSAKSSSPPSANFRNAPAFSANHCLSPPAYHPHERLISFTLKPPLTHLLTYLHPDDDDDEQQQRKGRKKETKNERRGKERKRKRRTGGKANPASAPATIVPRMKTALSSRSSAVRFLRDCVASFGLSRLIIIRFHASVICEQRLLNAAGERPPPGLTWARMRFAAFCTVVFDVLEMFHSILLCELSFPYF